MDDLLLEFLTETNESMQTLDLELVKLERNPNDPELLSNIFRLVHTIKGTSGFLGLPRLGAVAHAAETVLGKIRDGELSVTEAGVSLILESLDRIKSLLLELEEAESEPAGDDSDLIARLEAAALGEAAASAEAPRSAPPQSDPDAGFPVAADFLAEFEAADKSSAPPASAPPASAPPASAPSASAPLFERIGGDAAIAAAVDLLYRKVMADDNLRPFFDHVDLVQLKSKQAAFLAKVLGGPDVYTGTDLRTAHARLVADGLDQSHFDAVAEHLHATLGELGVDELTIGEVLAIAESVRADVLGGAEIPIETAAPPLVVAQSKPPTSEADAAKNCKPKESSVANQTIRVGVDVLENLMTMVSELVLTRNQLLQLQRGREDTEVFTSPLQRLNQITSELQEGVMKTRMQPIGNAWAKLPRIIRDISTDLGKRIDLQMHGAETELDRQVLELIRDPLTHMVRNSCDHGLETPVERQRTGKPPVGVIRLNAYHEGGHIIIQIKDDGRGLPLDKIKAKIISSGLASEAELAEMSDQQIQQFIFKAGLSTAAKVTSVSGRGVGMDVVKTNIEKIGGTIELQSTEGKGSVFTIKIPLTLAIVSALIVECAGERFAIPQINVLELVRTSTESEMRIEQVNDAAVLRLRDRLLPLVPLKQMLHLESDEAGSSSATGGEQFIVVSQVGTSSFGIIVDRVFDTEEIVVKPVAPILRDIQLFSGNTILGDGSVIMILDPNGIAASSGEITVADGADDAAADATQRGGDDKVALLIFRAAEGAPKAVPLALIARLEEFPVGSIEWSANGQMVVQYRDKLMPLITMDGGGQSRESGRQPVLVFADGGRSMGLVVDEIIDIIDTNLDIEMSTDRQGYLGSAIVHGKATDVIDTAYYLTQAYRDWFDPHASSNTGRQRLLLVDDSPFSRNLLTPLLKSAGYEVTTMESADDALGLCEAGRDFDVIVSDIELPGMNGFEFAQALKADARWRDVPMVALSTRVSAQDFERGRSAGFIDYVAKSDRDALIHSLSSTLDMVKGAA